MKIKKWTNKDVSLLKSWYTFIGDKEISIMLNDIHKKEIFTKKSIEKKRHYLKLKRTKEQVKLIMSDNTTISNLRIKEGEITVQSNHNLIKINNKMVPYSRYIYEKTHGKIPDGYIIIHKDFDTLNDDIDNLEARKRSWYTLDDFKAGLNIINYRINDLRNYNLMNWHKMDESEKRISMSKFGRLLKIKEKLEKVIIKKTTKKEKESGFYEPIEAF